MILEISPSEFDIVKGNPAGNKASEMLLRAAFGV
jgi:hypothetical protein